MRIVNSLFVFSIFLSAGLSLADSAPRAAVDTSGLGDSKIGTYLNGSWMNQESWIKKHLIEMLQAAAGDKEKASQKDAGLIGLTCNQTAPDQCFYQGEVDYQFLGVPKENEKNSKGKVIFIINLDVSRNIDTMEVKKIEQN